MTTTPQSKQLFRRFVLVASVLILSLILSLIGLIWYALDTQANRNLETESGLTTKIEDEVLQNYGLITPGETAEIGMRAPDFRLIDALSGEEIKLSDYVGKPIILNFWASWCGPCKMIAPVLDEVASEYADRIRVAKLNIDENPATPPKYGIRGIPTLMLFKNGEVEATKVGAVSKAQLTAFLDENI